MINPTEILFFDPTKGREKEMKKVLFGVLILAVFIFGALLTCQVYAADVYSPLSSVNCYISGTTTARNQGLTASGVSWFTVGPNNSTTIDLSSIKPNLGVFSIQTYQVSLAKSNGSNVTLTSGNGSGATYYLVYTVSNKDDANLWAGAGVTRICGPIALSGSTPVVQTFPTSTPEFARYMKIGVVSGMTQFETFKAILAVQ